MAGALEVQILQYLSPHNEVTKKFDVIIQEVLKHPGVEVLFDCMKTTKIPQVRQYCAFFLRKKILKAKHWKEVPDKIKEGLKATILELLNSEPDELFYTDLSEQYIISDIIRLLATIARHELRQQNWPELMNFLSSYIQSDSPTEKVIGLNAFSMIIVSAAAYLIPFLRETLEHFSKSLNDKSSLKIQFLTITCITNIIQRCGSGDVVKSLPKNLVPSVLKIIGNLVEVDTIQACKAMDIFDALLEYKVAVLNPHIKSLIEFCSAFALDQDLKTNVRIKALHIFKYIIIREKEIILELKLVSSILDVLLPIMYQLKDEDINMLADIDEDSNVANLKDLSVESLACQVLHDIATNVPTGEIISPFMHRVEPALENINLQHKKAAYVALAAITEGCSKYKIKNYLENYVKMIQKGMKEQNASTRTAVFYCLGQAVKHLKNSFKRYTSDLMALLLNYLNNTSQLLIKDVKDPPDLIMSFNALKSFCKYAKDKFIINLVMIIEILISFLDTKSVCAKEHSIKTIKYIASTHKKKISVCVPLVLERFQNFLCNISAQQLTKKNIALTIQVIDTIDIIAVTVGSDIFSQMMAHESINTVMKLIDKTNDSNLRLCVYNLFSTMSRLLKNDINQLDIIIKYIMNSITSEGIKARKDSLKLNLPYTIFEDFNFEDNWDNDLKIEENEDDSDADDDEEEEDYSGRSSTSSGDSIVGEFKNVSTLRLTKQHVHVYEKDAAFSALQAIASNSAQAFLPHLDQCFTEVTKLLKSPSGEIRSEIIYCLGQICMTLNQVLGETGSSNYRSQLEQKQNMFIPILLTTAKNDENKHVVFVCLTTLQQMLDNIKNNFIFNNNLESIFALITDALQQKLACPDCDGLLFKNVTDIIPSLVKIVSPKQFNPYFVDLLPIIISRTTRNYSIYDKSYTIGVLAEVISEIELGATIPFLKDILPIFLHGMDDDNNRVRSNSVYGLGTLILNANEALYDQYPILLQELSNMLKKENDLHARDNLCSAIAKIIIANTVAVPLKDIFPAFLRWLPLKVDLNGNIHIYKCLQHLYDSRSKAFLENIPSILRILSEVLSSRKINDETNLIVVNLLNSLYKEFPSVFKSMSPELSEECMNILRRTGKT